MRLHSLTATVAIAVLALAACGGDDDSGGGGDGGTLTVWTVEDVAERVETQKQILAAYTEATGTRTELVPVAEDQLTTVLTSSAAAGDLPDVIGAASLNAINQMRTDDLLDTAAAQEVVEGLGEDTFSPAALELTREGDEQLSVPSDGWAQLLFYRKDLLQQAGAQEPADYATITAAATALDKGDVAGIVAGTAPADSFTSQTFEQVALANGCRLTGDDGKITLDSPECVEAIRFYTDVIKQHSVPGNQDADTTRAAYFAGKAGMVIWSSFLLDELAGLRADAAPTCPQCQADPGFLAKNTGVVTAFSGSGGGEPATYGEVVSWALLQDGADEAKDFVSWMMGDGYERWLAIAPEGKVPARRGTADDAEKFVTAWKAMDAGVDTKAPLSDFYDAATLDAVAQSTDRFTRWGVTEGQGATAGAVAGQFVLPKVLAKVLSSGTSPDAAAKEAADQATQIQEDVAP